MILPHRVVDKLWPGQAADPRLGKHCQDGLCDDPRQVDSGQAAGYGRGQQIGRMVIGPMHAARHREPQTHGVDPSRTG